MHSHISALAGAHDLQRFLIPVKGPEEAASTKPTAIPGYQSRDVDPEWQKQVIGGLQDCLPEALQYILASSDKSVITLNRPGEIGRGSRKPMSGEFFGRSPAEIEGLYFFAPIASVMLAKSAYDKANDAYVIVKDVTQITIHEAMHALDDSYLGIRHQPGFCAAYKLDTLSLRSRSRRGLGFDKKFGYLLQGGGIGRGEALAEIGSQLFTGSCRAGDMAAHWPNTYCWVDGFFKCVTKYFNRHKLKSFSLEFAHEVGMGAERYWMRKHLVSNADFAAMMERVINNSSPGLNRRARSAYDNQRLDIYEDILTRQDVKGVQRVYDLIEAAPNKNPGGKILIP